MLRSFANSKLKLIIYISLKINENEQKQKNTHLEDLSIGKEAACQKSWNRADLTELGAVEKKCQGPGFSTTATLPRECVDVFSNFRS